MKVLVTGAAGFIGMHTAQRLLQRGDEVLGLDNLNDYYSVALKRARLVQLELSENFRFVECDVADAESLNRLFRTERPDRVIHLAAQAGVRYSLTNPQAYIQSNLVGFANIIEECRKYPVAHLVYSSSSSVYGDSTKPAFHEDDNVDHPISLYAATKKANELMAHAYSHLYGIATTGLRFFTVYGPWGRPDMSPMLFADAILAGRPIDVFNQGQMTRDFTYVDDIVEGVVRLLDKPATPFAPSISTAPFRIFNIGNSQPTPLLEYITTLEHALGKKAKLNLMPRQAGDVLTTSADTAALEAWVGFKPSTPLTTGIQAFADWYRTFKK